MQFSSIKGKIFDSPALLFVELWNITKDFSTFQRTSADSCADLKKKFVDALSENSGTDASNAVLKVILDCSNDLTYRKHGVLLLAMRTIDDFFLRIHPRHHFQSALYNKKIKNPDWLNDIAEEQLSKGAYVITETENLIARGPLSKRAKAQFSSGGECIADYFSALTMAPPSIKNGHRTVNIKHISVASGGLLGGHVMNQGRERVGFVPVAKRQDELVLTSKLEGSQGFVDVDLTVNALDVFSRILDSAAGLDVLIASELTVKEDTALQISDLLRKSGFNAPGLVIAGSGNTTSFDDDGFHWNESQIFNRFGLVLWQQRKTWTSGFPSDRAKKYGLECADGKFLLERNAESAELIIADVEGVGRCMTLICQDLESRPLAADAILYYQPDWVFVPVLDRGVGTGRWTHSRAFELSAMSAARFLVCSSLSLVPRPLEQTPACGLAIGPKQAVDGGLDEDRAYFIAGMDPESQEDYVEVRWRHGSWKQTSISAVDYPGRSASQGETKIS